MKTAFCGMPESHCRDSAKNCFLTQNFAEIRQLAAECWVMAKKLQRKKDCQSHWRKNFLTHIHYVATIPCESVRHKSNTFHTILALCTCLYRSHLKPVSMKQTKHSRKSEAENLRSKCPPFTLTHAFKRLCHCAITAAMLVWSSSLHTRSTDVLSRLSFEGYPTCCSPPDSNLVNLVATSLEG